MMKKLLTALLPLLAFCMALTACMPADQPQTTESSTTASTTENALVTYPTIRMDVTEGSSDLTIGSQGQLRISYTGNRNSAQYVTSAGQLPDYPELAGYDDAYFQDHALLLVTETVSSGSVQLAISSVAIDGTSAAVTVSHDLPGTAGTADMATWLLWAEVETGLDYQWSVANPALPSDAQAQ